MTKWLAVTNTFGHMAPVAKLRAGERSINKLGLTFTVSWRNSYEEHSYVILSITHLYSTYCTDEEVHSCA
jgi:hypothetical protein